MATILAFLRDLIGKASVFAGKAAAKLLDAPHNFEHVLAFVDPNLLLVLRTDLP